MLIPFIGTTVSNVLTKWGNEWRHLSRCCCTPSGFSVQLSPETRVTGVKGYNYVRYYNLYYFSCFRHMSGFPEGSAGHFSYDADSMVMKVLSRAHTSMRFSHKKESCRAGIL
jgi:hypothetical protein